MKKSLGVSSIQEVILSLTITSITHQIHTNSIYIGLLHVGVQNQPCPVHGGGSRQMHALVAAPIGPGCAAVLSLRGQKLQQRDELNVSGCVQGMM